MQVQTILTLGLFQNVDIYAQGYYQIRLKVKSARLGQASVSNEHETRKLRAQYNLRQPECGPDQTYRSKIFYIRYREEQTNLGEIVSFLSEGDKEPLRLTLELWFFERPPDEIASQTPPQQIQDVSNFKMVSNRVVLIKQLNTFEHFVVMFDQGFTSCIQLNIFSALKQLTSNNPIFIDQNTSEPSKTKQWDRYVDLLAKAYDELRQLHTNLSKNIPSTIINEIQGGEKVTFGPLSFDHSPHKPLNRPGTSSFPQNKMLHPPRRNQSIESDSNDEEIAYKRVSSPLLSQNKMVYAGFNSFQQRKSQPQINSQQQLTQKVAVKTTQYISSRQPGLNKFQTQNLFSNPHTISAVPPIRSNYQKNLQKHRESSKLSDEISSSGSEGSDSLHHTFSKQSGTKVVKSLFQVKENNVKPRAIHRTQKALQVNGPLQDEDIPAMDIVEQRIVRQEVMHRNFLQKKPGSRHLSHELAQVHSKVARITCLVFKLWHYIQLIIQKTLYTVSELLRAKYRKFQKEIHSRIIVQLEAEDDMLKTSIRESGVRVIRKNVKQIAYLEGKEVQQETPFLQPNKRGRPQEPFQIPKLAQPARSKSSNNFNQKPVTPSQIERSIILANNRRLDVSQQPEIQPLIAIFTEEQKVWMADPPKQTTQPIIIEEIYYDNEQFFTEIHQDLSVKNTHLFVFVHGFQASGNDMQIFKNHLQAQVPDALYLISKSNEKLTDSSIETLGLNLAEEIKQFVFMYLTAGNRRQTTLKDTQQTYLKKLSFVGHSLGGIIIRESLKHLHQFSSMMHGYISLGSPHLGYMYNSSTLVDAGMWVLKNWTQSRSLTQLSMTDAPNYKDSYLYKLSSQDQLGWFKYVILVGSYQDSYAPYDSARIQVCSKAIESQSKHRSAYIEMATNILGSLSCKQLMRLDVNFKIQDNTLASMIGRTAHIQMIECEPLILSVINKYDEVFRN